MRKFELKYSCCTGVPRPVIVENIDEEECYVFYNTAPIEEGSSVALIVFEGFSALSHYYLNDQENEYLKRGLIRDNIYRDQKKWILLFHNEVIEIEASNIREESTSLESSTDILNNLKTT